MAMKARARRVHVKKKIALPNVKNMILRESLERTQVISWGNKNM